MRTQNLAIIETGKKIVGNLRYPYVIAAAVTAAVNSPVQVFAGDTSGGTNTSGVNFDAAAKPVVSLIDSILGPLISVVGALAAIYCVLLGVKLAKADEPQEREKAKMALKNAIIGFFLIFILIVVMRILLPQLRNWVQVNSGNATQTTSN
ncbi:MAG: pilin [Lachnospiraceae bacterium]|nr:pilin [Lachnospiraceae bacterium]